MADKFALTRVMKQNILFKYIFLLVIIFLIGAYNQVTAK